MKNNRNDKFCALVPIQRWIEMRAEISDAIWLLMLLTDKVTHDIVDSHGRRWGLVLANEFRNCCPIKFKTLAAELRVSTKTVQDWHSRLMHLGLIHSKRTPHGYSFVVADSVKWSYNSRRTIQLSVWTVESWAKRNGPSPPPRGEGELHDDCEQLLETLGVEDLGESDNDSRIAMAAAEDEECIPF